MWMWLSGLWHRFWSWTPMYWLRCHTVTRYHIVDCRNATHDYKWGWMDRSELLLFATMSIVIDFVEKEKAFDCHVDWDYNDEFRSVKKEVLAIYEWWKISRKQEHDALSDRWSEHWQTRKKLFGDDFIKSLNSPRDTSEKQAYDEVTRELSRLEDQLYSKDEEMTQRLIKVRRYLWT